MKLELVLVLFLTFITFFNRCQALYWRYRPEVTISVGTFNKIIIGDYAEYGEYKLQIASSELVLIPDMSFGCTSRLSPNATAAISSVVGSWVLMVPMDLSYCSSADYKKAAFAQQLGASGLILYYPPSETRQFSSGSELKIPVAAIELSDISLNVIQEQLSSNRGVVSILGNYYQNFQSSQTFYFVVFSFCILTLLSCLWFMLSYIRKCRTKAQRRRRRVAAERETRQLLDNLPTKTHKSQLGVEEPTCAICLEAFHNKDTIRILPCQHEFHKKCIDPWLKLKKTCPMCKEDISTKNTQTKAQKHGRAGDETSSARPLLHGASNFSLGSSSSEETDSVPGPRVAMENREQNDQHTVVTFEEAATDLHQAASVGGEVAIKVEGEPAN